MLRTLERVAREVDLSVTERLNDAVRRIFGRVLKELSDLDNPMKAPVGAERGLGAMFLPSTEEGERQVPAILGRSTEPEAQSVDDLLPPPAQPEALRSEPPPQAQPVPGRSKALPSIAPDPSPDGLRSRFDPEAGVVYYNDRHADYLLVKADEQALLDYLATLVAKEYVVFNNPRAAPEDLAEEMVRMLVRVRRHLPRKP